MSVPHPAAVSYARFAGLAAMSGAVLALQVIFTRIFSIVIWHHFTYLVIGVALLGGGASGTFLAVRRHSRQAIEASLGAVAALFSLAILGDLALVSTLEFDPLRLQDVWRTLAGLIAYFVALFTTFFLGGLVVAGCFTVAAREAHRLYFIDLGGAGVATLAVLPVLQGLGGPAVLVLIALVAMSAALALGGARLTRWRGLAWAIAVGEALLLAWIVVAQPVRLPVPASKDLGWALRTQGVEAPELTVWNPVARVDVLPELVLQEPMIVGGISSTWTSRTRDTGVSYPVRLVTLDGTSMTGLYRHDGGSVARFDFLKHAVIGAAFELGIDRPNVLDIGVGGGLDIILARLNGAASVTAIELNADVVRLLTSTYADYGGRLTSSRDTRIIVAEGRSFLIRDTNRYDIIQGIGLDNVAALNGGAYVLAESYLYTVESIALALDRLTDRGVFSWTRGAGQPPREMLRLTGLAAEALRQRGVADPARHIAIIGNESEAIATLLVSRTPFSREAVTRLTAWAAANRFPVLFDPYTMRPTRYEEYLRATDPRAFEASYPFNIAPVTDDAPFFYNYFRFTDWRMNRGDAARLQRFPVGNLILVTLMTLSLVSAVAFILVPLWHYQRSGVRTPAAVPMLTYFAMLGLAYIFVEVVLIQRFTLLIGYPTLAVTTTIFSMLSFSALGSLLGHKVVWSGTRLRLLAAIAAVAVLAYAVALPLVVDRLLHLADGARVAAAVALAAPLAALMGLPFPSGLGRLAVRAPGLVPWAWGINGVCSVVGSSTVIFVSMLSNFTVAMAFAALFYAVAAVVVPALERTAMHAAGDA